MNQDKTKNSILPPRIEEHLKNLMGSLDLEENEENFHRLRDAWLEKERLFEGQTTALGMETVESLPEGDARGTVLLTSSGSLLSLYPEKGGTRRMEYASIPIRTDVPDLLTSEAVSLESAPILDAPVLLAGAPLKKSSPIYRMAVCAEGTPVSEQEKRIREAGIFLTNGFARINKSVAAADRSEIEHFTRQALAAYVANRNGLTQQQVKSVIDDYFTMIESGVLMGERVPLGSLGRLGSKVRDARKARVVKNPATGEEITVPAKPRRAVVKFFPSGRLRELAARIPVEDENEG